MKRLKDEYLTKIQSVISFSGKTVLEIGCGNGARTVEIATEALQVVAIEPDESLVSAAEGANPRANIVYKQGEAEKLDFPDASFDVVFYTLSLHHVPFEAMTTALDEAVRVVKKAGYIIFLEPAFKGSFFEAEIKFLACDGDERKEKARAYFEMLNHESLREVVEIADETVFQFDSKEDFISTLQPKRHFDTLAAFLESHSFILNAERRINIFTT